MKTVTKTTKNSNFIDTRNRICKACGLYLNQLPVGDNKNKASVFWVGLSAVLIPEEEEKIPLSPYTKSGALIYEIEQPFVKKISFFKTNVVKCLPLNNDKIRYPFKHEMEKCYPNLLSEIEVLKPSVIFLLGKQVSTFIFGKLGVDDLILDENFNYNSVIVDNIQYIPIHHPSYVLVYKRKFVTNYIEGISSFLKKSTYSRTKIMDLSVEEK
jgi:uracil-DNA glycosylase